MISKSESKFVQSLQQKKVRYETGLFLAEGVKLVEEIIQTDYQIKKIYATEVWASQHRSLQPVISIVTESELQQISQLQTPNQVLAIVHQNYPNEPPVFQNNITLVLDGIQDPGNLGTIIRIADWFGIQQIVCSSDTVELYNPKVIQATMGSFLRVSVYYLPIETMLSEAKVAVFGAMLKGMNMKMIAKPKEGILLIGNEGRGISPTLLPFISNPITIPKIGQAESLNAAVATGILLGNWC